MEYNYHTHTVRCGHAVGKEEEYIEAAIGSGIKKMGFSDHGPFRFPDGFTFDCHMQPERAEDYIRTVRRLQQEYKDKIELHVGFETEYFPLYHREKMDYYRSLGAEYLILGQHYLFNGAPNPFFVSAPISDEELLKSYSYSLISAMETGCFTYVAHPDMFRFTGEDEAYAKYARRICDAAKACRIPLEINLLGIRGNRHYPNEKFWKIAGESGVDVVFGMDAHEPKDAGDAQSQKRANELVEKYGLHFLREVELKKL